MLKLTNKYDCVLIFIFTHLNTVLMYYLRMEWARLIYITESMSNPYANEISRNTGTSFDQGVILCFLHTQSVLWIIADQVHLIDFVQLCIVLLSCLMILVFSLLQGSSAISNSIQCTYVRYHTPQITRFIGATWGPPGSCRPQPCYQGRYSLVFLLLLWSYQLKWW